jgi:ABC-2 type transport system ATP-binding protein
VAIIETVGLTKTFRSIKREPGVRGALAALFAREFEEKVAVHDVSFSVEPGEVVGYIGPNGAGKSTTIKMLTGILVPTSGTVRVAGIVPYEHRQANAENIGVVFGQRSQLYWDLPLRESFELLRSIYDVPRNRYRENLDEFCELLDLEAFMGTPVRQLSLGERMRGDFAAAMIHDPKIVFLDEPTIGLDVIAKEAIRSFVSRVTRERGTTVVLTTHDLADVERLAPRIILIDEGTVVYDGALERLREEYGTHRTLVVTLAEEYPDFAVEGAEVDGREGSVVRLRFDRRITSAEAIVRRVMEGYAISDLAIVEPDIESIVRRIYLEGYAMPPAPVLP